MWIHRLQMSVITGTKMPKIHGVMVDRIVIIYHHQREMKEELNNLEDLKSIRDFVPE